MLRSITHAYKAKDYLSLKGIHVGIVRTPSGYSKRGCGYSIVVKQDPAALRAMLERAGIPVLGMAQIR